MHTLHKKLNDFALDLERRRVRLIEMRITLSQEGKLSDELLLELKRMILEQSKDEKALRIEFAFPELYEAHRGNVHIAKFDPADHDALKEEIDRSLTTLQGLKACALDAMQNIVESTLDASSLNTFAENTTILRYQAGVYKQLYSAITMLKMLQNDRRNAQRQSHSILPNEPKRDTKA